MAMKPNNLPVVEDCNGCGVCCLHMGYPAFMLPRDGVSQEQIDSDPDVRQLIDRGWSTQELLDGNEGESNWHSLPDALRAEWLDFVDSYRKEDVLDGACFWFDLTTRQCRHHEFRPNVCRDFKIDSKVCRQWRNHYKDSIPISVQNINYSPSSCIEKQ